MALYQDSGFYHNSAQKCSLGYTKLFSQGWLTSTKIRNNSFVLHLMNCIYFYDILHSNSASNDIYLCLVNFEKRAW